MLLLICWLLTQRIERNAVDYCRAREFQAQFNVHGGKVEAISEEEAGKAFAIEIQLAEHSTERRLKWLVVADDADEQTQWIEWIQTAIANVELPFNSISKSLFENAGENAVSSSIDGTATTPRPLSTTPRSSSLTAERRESFSHSSLDYVKEGNLSVCTNFVDGKNTWSYRIGVLNTSTGLLSVYIEKSGFVNKNKRERETQAKKTINFNCCVFFFT